MKVCVHSSAKAALLCFVVLPYLFAKDASAQDASASKPYNGILSPAASMAYEISHSPHLKSKFKSTIVADSTAAETVIHGIMLVEPSSVREAELSAIGVTVNSRIDDIWTATVPVSSIALLASIKGVKYFDADMPIRTKLDTAAILAKANRSYFKSLKLSDKNGSGVIVGVVDNGFDYTHPSFNDSSGKSRIRYVWDQTTSGTPPSGFSYGNELASGEAVKAGQTDTPYDTHGTHVLSIAAAGDAGSPFVGIAPAADIILTSYRTPSTMSEYMSTSLSGVLDGVKYIFDKATMLGKPAVVNLSLGYHMGPHDGTSLFDRACDNLVGNGHILVGAAGNEGMRKLHLGLSFTESDTIYRTFVGLGAGSGTSIDAWGEVNRNFCVTLALFNKTSQADVAKTARVCTSENTYKSYILSSNDGYKSAIEIYATSETAVNGKPRITVFANNPSGLLLKMTVTSPVKSTHKVNIWNDAYGYSANFSSYSIGSYSDGDSEMSVGEIGGTGNRIITVGAFTSKNNYKNLSGTGKTISYNTSVGLLAPFSSKGPTADGRIKPDITAPGNGVVAALNSFDTYYTTTSAIAVKSLKVSNREYLYGIFQGTSMSAPVVSGIVALLLQQNPNLTPEQVKQYLSAGAIKDAPTQLSGSQTSNTWGSGKVSAIGALSELLGRDLTKVTTAENDFVQCRMVNNSLDGMVNIVCKTDETALLYVFDAWGRKVFGDVMKTEKQLDLSKYGNGIYFIKVVRGSQIGKCKVIVNH